MTGPDTPPFQPEDVERFHYAGYELDPATGALRCHYALDDLPFEERITFAPSATGKTDEAIDAAARLVFLLAGVSYYKAAAPPVVEAGAHGLTPAERRLLQATYLDGLGEYAYRNGLDLSGLTIEADDRAPAEPTARDDARAGRPLVPFGGGLDSIVTVEGVRDRAPDAALFVVSREGDRFDAIEGAAAVTRLPVVRAERSIDPKVLRSRELGYRNGHVPVTGIISAIAVMAAVLDGRDAVVMSNEWSASSGNVERDGRVVNHQWSKSLAFEDLFRDALAESLPTPVDYFSWLRPRSELWVAEQFRSLGEYHLAFRSCNRSFHIDRAQRLDHWCGRCDKCAFIDLILSPFLPAADLAKVFGGSEPLDTPELAEQFRTLLGVSGDIKPFECVGDVDECRVAVLLAADRDDRAGSPLLHALADEVRPVVGDVRPPAARLLRPLGPHRIPDRYAPADLLA
jgi:UDP-N-acetyl-alpha-D-muramoyl-L-alanyl-L-glutamate epimerase